MTLSAARGRKPDVTRTRQLALFIRASALGGTWMLPLAGAGSVGAAPTGGELVLLFAVASAFHVFAYVLNDVVDLPIDRTEPRRAQSPLVTGAISRRAALTSAILCVPAGCLAAAALSSEALAMGLLLSAVALMAGYDLWGKKAPLPWVIDVVQGISWAALLAWGAVATGTPTATTWLLAGYTILLIVMANGVHGSLRDLANDFRCGVRTTAIKFGARPLPEGGVSTTPALTRYAAALHVALVLLALYTVIRNDLQFATPAFLAVLAAVAAICAAGTWFAVRAWHNLSDGWAIRHDGLLHLALMVAVPLVVVAPAFDATIGTAAVVAFALPLASHRWLPGALRGIRRRTLVRPAPRNGLP